MTHAFKPLTKDDIAEVLGLSLRTVENWVNDGTLPLPKKLGNRVYWHPNVFYSWLDRRLSAADGADEMAQHDIALPARAILSSKAKSGAKPPANPLEKFRAREKEKLDAMLS